MNFFSRLSLGWEISINSLKVIKENKQLLLFPVFSGLAMLGVLATFVAGLFATGSINEEYFLEDSDAMFFFSMVLYYFVSYFIVLFFNVALIHCTKLYFEGEVPTIKAGINYSISRLRAIFLLALLAGIVGAILKSIQENTGWLGRLISGLVGIVWSIATFFVVPVVAYEEMDPIRAVKRSTQLMREKWGESIGSAFSFGIIRLIAMLAVAGIALLFFLIHPIFGIVFGGIGFLAIITILSAAEMIFVSAVYHRVNGNPVTHFQEQLVDKLFEHK